LIFKKNKEIKPKKRSTYKETLQLYQNGLTPDEIAIGRKLGLSTIISHIAKLYVMDVARPFLFVDEEINIIRDAKWN
jgi:ATP-dependent DNA helicase RecQ